MEYRNLLIQVLHDPLAIWILSIFLTLLLFAIYFYISAAIDMYRIDRDESLKLYNESGSQVKLSFFDRKLIKKYRKEDKKYKDLFDKRYAIELQKIVEMKLIKDKRKLKEN